MATAEIVFYPSRAKASRGHTCLQRTDSAELDEDLSLSAVSAQSKKCGFDLQ